MPQPILRITDGTDIVNLIDPGTGFHLLDWTPQIVQPKGGGVFSSSPMSDGRQKRQRVWDNAIETFNLIVNHYDQDALIRDTQILRRLLLKADSYWISRGDLGGMVWIEKRASCETNTSYGLIYDWRTPTDENPYSKPFMTDTSFVAMTEFVLVLERGHWTENTPGNSTCVEISGLPTPGDTNQYWYYWGDNQLENPGFETAGGGGADVFANWVETAGDGAIASSATVHTGAASALLTAGPTRNTVITQNQAGLTAGSSAVLGFWARGNGTVAGRYAVYNVTGAAYIQSVVTTGITAATFTFVSYSFTLPAGCTEVRIELWCADTNAVETRFDDISLRIRGSLWTSGMTATCGEGVFIANKQNVAQLTDVFRYDSSAGTYTQILGAALPYNLLPPDPPVNDIVYFIIDMSVPRAGPFSCVILDIGTASTNITTIVWEYPTAPATWATLNVVDRSTRFSIGSHQSVAWEQPADWVITTVNGITGWIVRSRITVTGGVVTIPTQQNRQIYTVTWNSYLIDDAQIGGDIGALRRVDHWNPNTDSGVVKLGIYRFISGLRSTSRGGLFTAFINLTNQQNPYYITTSITGAVTDVRSSLSPTGWVAQYSGAATGTIQAVINATVVSYGGTYRAFLRYNWIGAGLATDKCTVQLGYRSILSDPSYLSPVSFYFPNLVATTTGTARMAVIDLGQLTIPISSIAGNDLPGNLYLTVSLTGNIAFTVPLDIFDLVLIPVDESAYETITISREHLGANLMVWEYGISVDSIEPPLRSIRSVFRRWSSQTSLYGEWIPISAGEIIWQPNTDQRVYTLFLNHAVYDSITGNIERQGAKIEHIARVKAYRNQRYLGMRGER